MSQPSAFASPSPRRPSHRHQAPAPRIALVGVHGFGDRHLANVARLQATGVLDLVAIADPHPPRDGALGSSVAVFETLGSPPCRGHCPGCCHPGHPDPDARPAAKAALAAGADVYVEKPPAASLSAVPRAPGGGRIGWPARAGWIPEPGVCTAARRRRDHRERGDRRRPRPERYRHLAQDARLFPALALGGQAQQSTEPTSWTAWPPTPWRTRSSRGSASPAAHTLKMWPAVDTDLYHAHPTESDDTSVIRVRTSRRQVLTCALTLCAADRPSFGHCIRHGRQG